MARTPRLAGIAARYAAIGRGWSALADASLPTTEPLFAETRDALDGRVELFRAGATIEEMRWLNDRLEQLRRRGRRRVPVVRGRVGRAACGPRREAPGDRRSGAGSAGRARDRDRRLGRSAISGRCGRAAAAARYHHAMTRPLGRRPAARGRARGPLARAPRPGPRDRGPRFRLRSGSASTCSTAGRTGRPAGRGRRGR